MISEFVQRQRSNPKVLVENKITFAAQDAELSIYDTLSFSRKNPEHNGFNQALHHIETHFKDPLDIDVICKMACMSRTRFYQTFKQVMGCTPLLFQQKLRIECAAKMLSEGYSVTHAAVETGFVNVSHFSRCFKQYKGVKPSAVKPNNIKVNIN